jgi:hypothetical protein
MATANPSFKFVFIPADRHAYNTERHARAPHTRSDTQPPRSSQPMEELEQELVPGKEVECLTNRLQAHFRCRARRLRPLRSFALRGA